jgi:hypothetical protein
MGKEKKNIYPASVSEIKKVETIKMVTVTFRENRSFDLHVGREIITFGPRETKPIPVTWLKHRDFLQQQSKFVIKGV